MCLTVYLTVAEATKCAEKVRENIPLPLSCIVHVEQ